MTIRIEQLGRLGFEEALRYQKDLVERRRAGDAGDTVLFLEHEPVFTIGRSRDRSSLGDPNLLSHPVVEISRGGLATFHGPGQLVGYLILDLNKYGRDVHLYLRALEEALLGACGEFGLVAQQRDGLTGVWIGDRKVASIGVGVRHWITLHGFAINVSGDLSPFDQITPCGISGVQMTSLSKELGHELSLEEFTEQLTPHLVDRLDQLRRDAAPTK